MVQRFCRSFLSEGIFKGISNYVSFLCKPSPMTFIVTAKMKSLDPIQLFGPSILECFAVGNLLTA